MEASPRVHSFEDWLRESEERFQQFLADHERWKKDAAEFRERLTALENRFAELGW